MQILERAKFALAGLFWLYTSEANNWKLTVVTPMVDKEGPLKTYLVLGKLLRGTPSLIEDIDPLTITALSPQLFTDDGNHWRKFSSRSDGPAHS